jgi:ABC-2 type transport system ATP-binding protein
MPNPPVILISHLTHAYNDRRALDDVSLQVEQGEIFSLLGPNGSGKTTLFRILSTLMPGEGNVSILGLDIARNRDAIRRNISVVFQSPSVDRTLTARENLRHHGHLYAVCGDDLKKRIEESLRRVNLSDRADERVETFSGGMRRRVEIAKCLLTRPKVLLLDEPSTGLDPAARIDLWTTLRDLQQNDGVTILLTTHLMDEADRSSRIAILSKGRIVACDTPPALKETIGGDIISLSCDDPPLVQAILREKLSLKSDVLDGIVRIERVRGHELVPAIIEAAPGKVQAVSVGKPTLEDVFIRLTGHRFLDEIQ